MEREGYRAGGGGGLKFKIVLMLYLKLYFEEKFFLYDGSLRK